jgi:aspartyl-tRNA(Asn)/glutamyl-tRNA(Gln) amidotransferase subunit B
MTWEAVIGIETHVELRTQSKMFCGCPTDFGAEPNTNVCPVCLGLPGALPVPNETAIRWTIALGLALGSTIAPHSVFHRKNYFYADLPKNYQISQFDLPLCSGGHLEVDPGTGVRRVGITRVHLEEDTGKSTHLGGGGRIHDSDATLLDFNRSGIPLMEVVTDPDIRTPDEARAYAHELREVVLALGISDARLEEGSMRFDANVSLRRTGTTALGTKVEVKNMNSLRSVQRALAYEIERQTKLLDSGVSIAQETRHWDEEAGLTRPGRSKEESSDYRYFAEPDLVPLATSPETIAALRRELPELPAARRARYVAMGIEEAAVRTLVAGPLVGLFEAAVEAGAAPRSTANWVTGEIAAHLNRSGGDPAALALDAAGLAQLVGMVEAGKLSSTAAKEVLEGVLAGEGSPEQVAAGRDLLQVSDESAIAGLVAKVLAEHPGEVARVTAGEEKLIGFLVGQVMRAGGGKADPKVVDRLVRAQTHQ